MAKWDKTLVRKGKEEKTRERERTHKRSSGDSFISRDRLDLFGRG